MTKIGKKITLGVVAALATLCCAFGVTTLGNRANLYANADFGTMTVDALGYATWSLKDDDGAEITADSYQWSYAVGGPTYGPYVTDDDGANVGEALTRAVKYAQANGRCARNGRRSGHGGNDYAHRYAIRRLRLRNARHYGI